jgi:hypothetical protein
LGRRIKKSTPGVIALKKDLKWWGVFGLVEVEERIWRRSAVSYERVFAAAIGVSHRGKSALLERVLSDFGVEHSFVQAAARVKEHYGFEITTTAVRKAMLKTARRAQNLLEGKCRQSFRVMPAEAKETIIAQADGTMICTVAPGKRSGKRPRSWSEMRLVAAQVHGASQAVYGATFGSVEQAGRAWAHCARDAGRGLNSHIHVVADGAPWIGLQATEVFGKDHRFSCDFFHVSEYLAAAAKTCAPSRSESWRKTQHKRLKRSASHLVVDALARHIEPPATPDTDAPVRNAHRYRTTRSLSLDYQSALDRDLPIGSGLIESGHRHVLQARLKKAGTSRLPQTADCLAQLRVLQANNLWPSLWNN